MSPQQIEEHVRQIILELETSLQQQNYIAAINALTMLGHCNISLRNEWVTRIESDASIVDAPFRIELSLIRSEQMLNESRITEAEAVIEKVLKQSETIRNTRTTILALLQKAVLNLYLDKKPESIAILEQCVAQVTGLNDHDLEAEVYIYGYHFFSEADAEKAGEYIFKALDLAIESKNTYRQAYSLMHIGTLNTIISNNDEALRFFGEAYALFSQLKLNICMADNLMCQFNVFFRKQQFEKAADCLNTAIALGQNCGWDHKIALCYGNLSTTYLRLSRPEEAYAALQRDIAISQQLNNTYNIGVSKYRMGKIASSMGKHTEAIGLFNESLKMREGKLSNSQMLQVYEDLYPEYTKIGDYKSAFEAQGKVLRLKIDNISMEKAKEVEAQREKYEAGKREAELREARLQQAESELRALKAQMNPHFIFNTISSVNYLIQDGLIDDAQTTLRQFAGLMRTTLQQSIDDTIILEEEIKFLQNYLHLESLSYGQGFSFNIHTDSTLDTGYERIPAMMLQPIVENALKHGLRTKQGEQKLSLTFMNYTDHESEGLKITIQDNGIGRAASAELNKGRLGHQSYASKALEERVALLNSLAGYQQYTFSIHDLYEDGAATGTLAELTIRR